MESDALDAQVAEATGLAARTVKNVLFKLQDEGLIEAFPDKDELATIIRWNVVRTNAPR
jgi:transcription initiation factor IIE alpha subunit